MNRLNKLLCYGLCRYDCAQGLSLKLFKQISENVEIGNKGINTFENMCAIEAGESD